MDVFEIDAEGRLTWKSKGSPTSSLYGGGVCRGVAVTDYYVYVVCDAHTSIYPFKVYSCNDSGQLTLKAHYGPHYPRAIAAESVGGGDSILIGFGGTGVTTWWNDRSTAGTPSVTVKNTYDGVNLSLIHI